MLDTKHSLAQTGTTILSIKVNQSPIPFSLHEKQSLDSCGTYDGALSFIKQFQCIDKKGACLVYQWKGGGRQKWGIVHWCSMFSTMMILMLIQMLIRICLRVEFEETRERKYFYNLIRLLVLTSID